MNKDEANGSKKLTISLRPDLVAKLEKYETEERRTRSNAIAFLVESALAAREEQKRAS